ncbi:hypothetical protein BD779DRAFT_1534609 [Infundibulicybe gibba]|nr:hypothetical protein BD779DRAFT_1534609 [Infundibulicybe gibba]
MPSLFSRSRTNSTPKKQPSFTLAADGGGSSNNNGGLDEFGRVSSRISNRAFTSKDKKKAKEQNGERTATPDRGAESPLPDGTFLPLSFERPRSASTEHNDYGYLSYERHVVLGLEQIFRLVDVLVDELGTRGGITTPFIFSTTALDVSAIAIKRLIRAFLETCFDPSRESEHRWREEARFAGPHELGMCLRWGLARAVRSVGGQEVRGLIAWDHYLEFRDSEHGITQLPPVPLFHLPSSTRTPLRGIILAYHIGAHAPSLSPLFGPLLFGLGPPSLAFHHTYIHYLRAAGAAEHLLLAFIRWQDDGSAASLGVPTRLKEWIKGYPTMLPFLQSQKNEKPQARRGARTIRVMSVRRNVRMYSPDLVKSAAAWAHRSGGIRGGQENGLAASKEWERVAPTTLRLAPRYSEAYKKRMDMPSHFNPDSGPGAPSTPDSSLLHPSAATGLGSAPSSSSYNSTVSSAMGGSLLGDKDMFGSREGVDRFKSLTDLKWGEFESMGFGGIEDEKKLQFDLTESSRNNRTVKRQTLSWNDFSTAGFTRADDPLSATLKFSAPVSESISAWPAHSAELAKKLKKTHKALPPFGWDTEPIIGNEEVIEEAFVDVFCDLVYGGGWMDLERAEEVDRDCNWALIEFKALPASRAAPRGAPGATDPRSATSLILFEEFVPLEYRQQLADPSTTRRKLPSLFSPSGKSKQWKQAATLNGRPYVVGHVPRSPSYRELEFEGLLRGGNSTKVISLEPVAPSTRTSIVPVPPEVRAPPPLPPAPALEVPPRTNSNKSARSEEASSDSTATGATSPQRRTPRFRLPGGIPVPSPGGARKSGMVPAEYMSVEFETRLASYSDDEHNGRGGAPESEAVKQKRRQSKDDAWVDILVGSQNRRMGGQDAEIGKEKKRGLRGQRSDPELAGLEVALAAVRARSPSPPSVFGDRGGAERIDRDYGAVEAHLNDLDVDEIETVPRVGGAKSPDETLDYTTEPDADDEDDTPIPVDDPEEEESIGATSAARQMAQDQRRLGYFDLHPERRPVNPSPVMDEDPRDRLAHDSDEDEDDLYGPPETPPAPPPTAPEVPRPRQLPVPVRALPVPPTQVQIPEYNPADDPSPEAKEVTLPKIELAVTTPAHNGNGNESRETQDKVPDTAGVAPSKTATLIEMYRERERGAAPKPAPSQIPVPTTGAPVSTSRLPVRSASLPKDAVPLPTPPVAPPVPVLSPKPSPLELTTIEPPRVLGEETGRASPARYVHGAPLHNVLEEEEEE